jgi:hypothetical protein
MKTTLLYGLGMAIAGILLTFALYLTGFHSSVEKFTTGQTIGSIGGTIIMIAGLILAVRARRAETPVDEEFSYGRSLGAGTLTSLWSSLFGVLFNLVYSTVINPGMNELIIETQSAKMAEAGMSADQIEAAEAGIRMMTHPAIQAAVGFIFIFLFSFVISLIVAAFVRRKAVEDFSAEVPPPIAG